jgi:gluconate 2-dehydrogenase alpha chain
MSNQLPKTDVLIIGLGAAGGIASYVLTQAGIDVVALEAGPRRDKADFLRYYDELQAYPFHNPFADIKANKEIPTWRPNAGAPVQTPPVGAIVMDNQVGGTSIHWTGQSWRYREDDFKIRSTTVEKYGEEALPDGSNIVDWPISYDDLEPYYDLAEYLTGISGEGGANPFEAPRKRDYPLPPLRRSGFVDLANEGLQKAGYHPFPGPAGMISEDYGGRPACSYCGYCTGHGCWNDAKASTLVSAIPAAEQTGKLEIRTNSRVIEIVSNDMGQVTGVRYLDADGVLQEQPAGVVILSTYVYENVRLMLLSPSDYYPNGLGNNAGNVGKWYMAHSYGGAYATFPGQRFNLMSGTFSQCVSIDDFNGDNFDHSGLGFIRGAVASIGQGESTPIGRSNTLPPGQKGWGSENKKYLVENIDSHCSLGTQLEVLPYDANFLDLDPDVVDDLGMPRIRITFDLYDNEKKMSAYINPKLEEVLKGMGAAQTWSYPDPAIIPINSHAYGGTRMGDDPATSVVNKYGLSHEASNLMVLGASDWCSTTGYNPTETVYAHAWYAADYLAENLDSIAV